MAMPPPPERPSPLLEEIQRAMSRLEALESYGARVFVEGEVPQLDVIAVVASALRLSLALATQSLGECQMDIPYSPMHPVRRPDGELVWCCNHTPQHCGQ
jgi:hypothetical protein